MLLSSLTLTSAPSPWPPSPYPSTRAPSIPSPITSINSSLPPSPQPPLLPTSRVKSLARDTFASSATGSSARATTCRSTREPTQTSAPSPASSVARGFEGQTTSETTCSHTGQLDRSAATTVERVSGQPGLLPSTGWSTPRAAPSVQQPTPLHPP